MSQYAFYPSSAAGNPSVGPNGVTAPTSSTEVGGIDPNGNLQPLQTDLSGNLLVSVASEPGAPFHVIVDSSALPAGASTSAKQDDEIALLTTIDASASDIDTNTSDTASNTAASAISLASIDSKLTNPLPVSGTMTVVQPTGSNLHVEVDASALPSGAATSANQATEIASLASIDSKLTNPLPVSGPLTDAQLRATPVPVSGTVITGGLTDAQLRATPVPVSGTVAVSNLPSTVDTSFGAVGASTIRTGAQIGNASGAADFGAGAAGAQTLRVVAATGGAAPSPSTGRAFSNAPVRNDYTSTAVTTGAYVQLVASTASVTNLVEVFDSSGQTMALAVGGAGSEVIQFYIYPGGNGQVPLAIPASSRISIKAVSATASVGEIDVNFYT